MTVPLLPVLPGLPDHATVRAHPCLPGLGGAAWQSLAADLEACLTRLAGQGRLTAFGCELLADGHLLVIAWTASQALSGCSHDALTAVLAAHARDGQRLLDAPPLILGTAPVQVVDRQALRALLAAGTVDGATPLWDPHQAHLGAFRARGCVPLARHPLGARLGVAPPSH